LESVNVITEPKRMDGQTDRQTERWMTCRSNTSICRAFCGKKTCTFYSVATEAKLLSKRPEINRSSLL